MKSAFFAYLSGAPVRIGWERDFLKESVSRFFYTEVVKPKRIHIIDQQMELLKPLGIDPDWKPKCRCSAPKRRDRSIEKKLDGLADYVLINPGGNWPTKCWEPERYGELAWTAHERWLPVAVTWGPGEEDLVQTARSTAGDGVRQIPTTLEELVALCERRKVVRRRRYRSDAFCGGGRHADRCHLRPDKQRSQRTVPARRYRCRARLPCRPCYERDRARSNTGNAS